MIKKNMLFLSSVGSLLLLGLIYLPVGDYCYSHNWCQKILDLRGFIGPSLAIFPIILLFSLITYKMRDEVFNSWKKFSIWYVPIFILLAFIMANQSHGGDFSGVVSGWFNTIILLFFLGLFFIISLILIISKHFSSKK